MREILVIGGDLRFVYLANFLQGQGENVSVYGLEDSRLSPGVTSLLKFPKKSPAILIVPMPFSKEEGVLFAPYSSAPIPVSDVYNLCHKNQWVFGGHFSKQQIRNFRMMQCNLFDFNKDAPLATYNSIATAEGAIAYAIAHSTCNLHGKKVLVLGFGKCGIPLALRLRNLCCEVTIFCRRREVAASASSYGFPVITLEDLDSVISQYSYLFNTIPSPVLTNSLLLKAMPGATIIDIASAPGGLNHTFAKEINLNAHLCPGLPGIYAPEESGQYLCNTILENLEP